MVMGVMEVTVMVMIMLLIEILPIQRELHVWAVAVL